MSEASLSEEGEVLADSLVCLFIDGFVGVRDVGRISGISHHQEEIVEIKLDFSVDVLDRGEEAGGITELHVKPLILSIVNVFGHNLGDSCSVGDGITHFRELGRMEDSKAGGRVGRHLPMTIRACLSNLNKRLSTSSKFVVETEGFNDRLDSVHFISKGGSEVSD